MTFKVEQEAQGATTYGHCLSLEETRFHLSWGLMAINILAKFLMNPLKITQVNVIKITLFQHSIKGKFEMMCVFH